MGLRHRAAVATGALLLAASLQGCGGERSAVAWEETEVSVGEVFRHAEWSGRVAWRIEGARALEILGLHPACGCVRAETYLEGGEPLTPGVYPPGTRGEVVLRVRPGEREVRKLHEVAPMVWRFPGEDSLQVAHLSVHGEVLDAWEVEPPAVRIEEVAPDETPEIVLRWRALVDAAGPVEAAFEGSGVVLGEPQETVAAEGRREIVLRASILRPEGGGDASGRIHLRGLDPPAPSVPVHATFARRVQVSPHPLVTLLAQEGGGFGGEVLLRLAGHPDPPAGFSPRVEIEPADAAKTLAVESEHLSPGEVRLRLSSPPEAASGRRFGSLLIHHGIDTDPPVRLFWYLRS